MEFTRATQIFNIGDKIFPVDLSAFHMKSGERDWCGFKKDEARNKLKNGKPMVVISIPYLIPVNGWFENEYYIDVKFEDSDETYVIFNSNTNVFKNFFTYLGWIEDAEECAAFGY